ncbi:MAG: isochorismatase family cysteine hydrolase [Acidobacteriota bacterium]|jgi:nicotinamidase-related amidase
MSGHTALIVTDMLNDFVHGSLASERAGTLIPVLQELTAAAREAGVPVIFTNDAHLKVDVEMAVWGEHAMLNTEGAQVIPELAPQENDFQIPKRTYSAFHGTGLDSVLRGLDVNRVLLTGVHTHICGLHTAADAFFRGFKIAVVTDAINAFTAEDHAFGLEYIEKIYGAEMLTSDEVLAEWKEAAA